MKNNYHHLFLITVLFLFLSCEKDELVEEKEVFATDVSFEYSSIEELLTLPILGNQQYKDAAFVKSAFEDANDFVIDTARISKIITEDYISYTAVVRRPTSNKGMFENIVIMKWKNNPKAKAFIIEYKPDSKIQFLDYHESFAFNGARFVRPISLEGRIFKSSGYCGGHYEWWCSYQGDHVAGSRCFEATDGRVFKKYIEDDCTESGSPGTGSGGGNDSDPGTGGGGGGGTPPGGDEPVITLPMYPDGTSAAPSFLSRILNLTDQSQINWLETHISDAEEMLIFVEQNERSLFSKECVRYALSALINNGQVDYDKKLINDPGLKSFLISRMSATEMTIFENISVIQQAAYLRAATEAYLYAEIFYPQPVRNRKGDAVKHTLWNALSTNYIGATLTKQLTDAHEVINYDPNYTNHYKETQMDLFNNAKGRDLAAQYGSLIFQLVEDALSEGDLRYLSNLIFLDGFYNATDDSILIPSNE